MVSGKVNGRFASVMLTHGRESFTVARATGQNTGVFKITFSEALLSSDYAINLTTRAAGTIKVWETPAPKTKEFHVVTYGTTNSPINCVVYSSVFAVM